MTAEVLSAKHPTLFGIGCLMLAAALVAAPFLFPVAFAVICLFFLIREIVESHTAKVDAKARQLARIEQKLSGY